MGMYINRDSKGNLLPAKGKAGALIADGATHLPELPKVWQEGLVCVVTNEAFDAAGFAYDVNEMVYFLTYTGQRPVAWLLYPKARELAA